MRKLFRIILSTSLLLVGAATAVAPAVFAWSPLQLTVDCGSNGQLTWTAKANGPESDLNVDFASDAAFTMDTATQTLDSTTLTTQFITSTSVATGYVRWSSDHTVVTGPVDAPANCEHTNPKGSIGGPCADPAYYGVFDNSDTTSQTITFRMRWTISKHDRVKVKAVPAGAIFRTWTHWAKPGTTVYVEHKDPTSGTWVLDASVVATRGRYPKCDYTPGWQKPS